MVKRYTNDQSSYLKQTISLLSLLSIVVKADRKQVVLQIAHCLSSSGNNSKASLSASVENGIQQLIKNNFENFHKKSMN